MRIATFLYPVSLIVFGLIAASTVYSAVPNVFKGGEVASASKINDNFNSLDSRIISLETPASSGGATTPLHTVPAMPQQISVEVGSTVSIGGKDFIIYAIPVVDFADGSRHIIKYPRQACNSTSSNCDNGVLVSGSTQTYHGNAILSDSITINGYEAALRATHGRRVTMTSNAVYDSGSSSWRFNPTLSSANEYSWNVTIQIGASYTSLFLSESITEFSDVEVSDYSDLTKEYEWDAITQSEPSPHRLSEFLQYVSIIDL